MVDIIIYNIESNLSFNQHFLHNINYRFIDNIIIGKSSLILKFIARSRENFNNNNVLNNLFVNLVRSKLE